MTDTVLTLIAPGQRVQDENGVWRTRAETRRTILARMDSIDRGEFFAAGESGLRPEYRFTVNACEYAGEPLCEWEGMRFAVYRTYQLPGTDALELYTQRKAGITNGA